MGYTHYFTVPKKFNKKIFAEFVSDCRKIVDIATDKTNEFYTELDATINNNFININGVDDDAHENFYIKLDNRDLISYGNDNSDDGCFCFCKTARKPYDSVVVACLIALDNRFGSAVKISTDGSVNDWKIGKRLYDVAIKG